MTDRKERKERNGKERKGKGGNSSGVLVKWESDAKWEGYSVWINFLNAMDLHLLWLVSERASTLCIAVSYLQVQGIKERKINNHPSGPRL